MTAILLQATDAPLIELASLNILGLALLAGFVGVGVAFAYRAVTINPIPAPIGILCGVTVPAIWLLISSLQTGAELSGNSLTFYGTSLYYLGAFVVGGALTEVGRRVGDYIACQLYEIERVAASGPSIDAVRASAFTESVTLPETIDDVAGYEPVDEETKSALAGKTMRFPQGLSNDTYRERITTRLERDFDVDSVTIEFAGEGTIETMAIGTVSGNVSPSLPPGRVAVTIEADVEHDATTGDVVEVWSTKHGSIRLVGIGRIWSRDGRQTTITVTESDADAFDIAETYRLLTRAGLPNEDSELTAVIDSAAETVASISVTEGGPFEGEFAGWLPGTVTVLERDGEPITFPTDRTTIQAGDTVYVFGTSDQLQQLDTYAPNNNHTSSKRSIAYE